MKGVSETTILIPLSKNQKPDEISMTKSVRESEMTSEQCYKDRFSERVLKKRILKTMR